MPAHFRFNSLCPSCRYLCNHLGIDGYYCTAFRVCLIVTADNTAITDGMVEYARDPNAKSTYNLTRYLARRQRLMR